MEHLRLLADDLEAVNGYRLTLINDKKIILDQTVRMKDTLEVSPEDIAIVDQFIEKIIDLK